MKQIRKGVFETNSSSTHSLTFISKGRNGYYTLTESGYILVGFDEYFSESNMDIYFTLEDKLTFIFSLIAGFIYEEKYRTGLYSHVEVTRYDFMSNKDVKQIRELLKMHIPNCKGFKFRKGSFGENTECLSGVDTHHFQNCKSFQEYLKKNELTLAQLVLSPHIVIQMNQ